MPQYLIISGGVAAIAMLFGGATALFGQGVENAGQGVNNAGNGALKAAAGAALLYWVYQRAK